LSKGLLIVESPAKAKTIEKFLGRRFTVAASMGHVRDLPRSQLGVDVEHGFQPRYITIRGKGEVVAELRERVRRSEQVLLATDPDREGEAISWHLCQVLGLPEDRPLRITFHEITREAVQRALAAPRPIDQQLVLAQQARRVLDRLVGYKLSPLLWKKVRGGLSAGRVQSVAVRLIVDREEERRAFQPEEYWTLEARLTPAGKPLPFAARYWGAGGERVELKRREQVDAVVAAVSRPSGAGAYRPFRVQRVRRGERRRNPAPPFTTATLQQEAARKLGFGVARTMRIAQQLYEGLPVEGQHVGLITYMRTDSVRVAEQAQQEAAAYVRERWGEAYAQPRAGTVRAGAQDAHEAIRPTSVQRTPESLAGALGRDQLRLYRLIWERFLASQMAPAVLDTVTADIVAAGTDHVFRATGSTVRFAGFMTVYTEGRDEPAPEDEQDERLLPELAEGQDLVVLGLEPEQHFTEPPPRYTEAMLVRALEEKGIGRPSTYAPIIETIQERGYVAKEERRLYPTELGTVVTDLLKRYFPSVVDVAFTAQMERELDRVESGERDWQDVVREFYDPFARMLERAEEEVGRVTLAEDTATDEVCELCGRPMVVRHGRFGPFLACSGYPECKHTRPILQKVGVACPRCGGDLVARRSRRGRTFYGCATYPACDFVVWDRPVGRCPVCGGLLVEKRGRRGGRWLACNDPACGYRGAAGGEPAVVADGGGAPASRNGVADVHAGPAAEAPAEAARDGGRTR
jgi:DNA topoisomerase-1